jgi:beta-lactamase superfamily II metal-dependent hydrolase
MRRWLCAAAIAASVALVSAQARFGNTLTIYAIDVEGGNATLFVSPSGESLLIDTGNGGAGAARDAGRIVDAAKDAGITRIDHLITTHWHGDHFGGLAELAKQMPIAHFYDHGANVQPTPQTDQFIGMVYGPLVAKAAHTVLKPADTIAMKGLTVRVVAAAGEVVPPMRGAAKTNEDCASLKPVDAFPEDRASIATFISYGNFRALHPGDLTRDIEFRLVCPETHILPVDVLVGPHHGQDTSNSNTFVHALRPRVAIMNNGTRKGGYPDVMKAFYSSPGFEDLWQLHFSQLSGQEYAAPGVFIANTTDESPTAVAIEPMPLPQPGSNAPAPPAHNGRAYWIKIAAHPDGSFTVTNARNNFAKTYPPR